MDVISDHSQGTDPPPPEAQQEYRVRWGNVALALAALGAIAAAIALPRGDGDDFASRPVAPVTDVVTAPVPSAAVSTAPKPKRHGVRKKHVQHRRRAPERAHPSAKARPAPAVAVPTPIPAPASPAPNRPPAAEREFGL